MTGGPASLSADLAQRVQESGLDPDALVTVLDAALAEDLAGGEDVTSVATVPAQALATGVLASRARGVVAGLDIAEAVLERAARRPVSCHRHVADGDRVVPGQRLATVSGRARDLLLAERTALNLLGHLSGIATLTRSWVDAVAGTSTLVRDTRKTTPLLRALEKYAVRCGGGTNHRMSLSDAALIKDNHVLAAGGVVAAFQRVRATYPDLPVEVEVDTVPDAVAAVEAGADLVLLDNFSLDQLDEAVARVAGRARLEASGGLTLQNAPAVAATGVDYLAVGALTHSAPVLDIGLDFDPPGRPGGAGWV